MNLSSLISALLVVTVFDVGLCALVLLVNVMFPNVIARTQHNAEAMPIRSLVVGLINFIFFGLIAAAFLSGRDGVQVIGLSIGTILLSFIMLGIAAIARLVGGRIMPHEPSTIRQVLVGALTLELAALVPFVGWFVVPALVGLVGYGALIIALIWRRDALVNLKSEN